MGCDELRSVEVPPRMKATLLQQFDSLDAAMQRVLSSLVCRSTHTRDVKLKAQMKAVTLLQAHIRGRRSRKEALEQRRQQRLVHQQRVVVEEIEHTAT